MNTIQADARGQKRLLFYSDIAFYKPFYSVFEVLKAKFDVQGYVITHENAKVPRVYSPKGYLDPQSAGFEKTPDFVTVLPESIPLQEKVRALKSKLGEIHPDYIWAHVEPTEYFVNQMLRWFYFQRSPRIVAPVVENIWRLPGGLRAHAAHFRRCLYWRRYAAVLACASKSREAIRKFGMPDKVPISIAWLPHLAPPPAAKNGAAPFLPGKSPGEFFVGFCGRVTAAKGWKVLLAAMQLLPASFKCLIAGAGGEEDELRRLISTPPLQSRVHFVGVLEKEKLWNFYRALDVLVLPSLTTPTWTEQFGSVMAEAMACGIPVIGSDSGAIREVIGDAGIVVEEQNPGALAEAIRLLESNFDLRRSLGEKGTYRFQQEFTCEAYARRVADAFGLCAVASANIEKDSVRSAIGKERD